MGSEFRIARAYALRQVPVAVGDLTSRMRAMSATLSGSSLARALLAALLFGACSPSQKVEVDASAASASATTSPLASASAAPSSDYLDSRGGDDIRPVYPVDAGAPDPLAQRYCDAVLALPERRRGECCGAPSGVAAAIASQCVRTLTFALGQHALTLAPADVDRCVEAVTKATSGCDWVTPSSTAVPSECDGILKGARAEKAQCRSSLECAEGMRCLGLSTIDTGTCGPPKATNSQCNLAVDTLAAFTRQDHLERTHPECEGFCARNRCEAAVTPGGPCNSDVACGHGRCASGKCASAPPPIAGEACTETCAAGARCLKGKCTTPKAEGDGCEADAECRGTCVRADGGTAGTCAKSCPTFFVPRTPAHAPTVRPLGRPGGPPPRKR
jgi:hypothetical protein